MSNPRLGLTLILCALLSLLTVPAATSPAIATVQIAVVASGAGNLTYQWYRAGVAVAGQTSSSISVPSSDASLYTVVVKDADGSTQTAGATVTVSTPVPVLQPPPPSTTCRPARTGWAAGLGDMQHGDAFGPSAPTSRAPLLRLPPRGTTFARPGCDLLQADGAGCTAGDRPIGAFGAIIDGGGFGQNLMDGATVVIANITPHFPEMQKPHRRLPWRLVLTSTGWSVLN